MHTLGSRGAQCTLKDHMGVNARSGITWGSMHTLGSRGVRRNCTFLCQAEIIAHLSCRENWLFHVIQATWEARTVGWLKLERPTSPVYRDSVAALYDPLLGRNTCPTIQLRIQEWKYCKRIHQGCRRRQQGKQSGRRRLRLQNHSYRAGGWESVNLLNDCWPGPANQSPSPRSADFLISINTPNVVIIPTGFEKPELEYLVPNKWDLTCQMPLNSYLNPTYDLSKQDLASRLNSHSLGTKYSGSTKASSKP